MGASIRLDWAHASSITDRERRELAVGAVVETRVAAQEAEGDAHDKREAAGDQVAHGSDLGRLGSHAPGLDVWDRQANPSQAEESRQKTKYYVASQEYVNQLGGVKHMYVTMRDETP